VIANLKLKTGRSIEEWVRLLEEEGPATDQERIAWLKAEHGIGSNYIRMITERAAGKGLERTDPDAYLVAAAEWVDAMFAGPKAGLRPIYDRLITIAMALGNDVAVSPCQTVIPIYRKQVFAQIRPVKNSRLDLGLALGAPKPVPRLIETGGLQKGDRITHRIELSNLRQVDEEVRHWLSSAYRKAAITTGGRRL
jgi:hypothetical protein